MSDEMQAELTHPSAAEKPAGVKFSKKAFVSVLLGVLGLSGVLFAAAIVAIVLGKSAKQEIDASGKRGRGVALTGVILGWVGIGVAVCLLALLLLTNTSAKVS
jgi:membrane associated rhomboid family serine protease